jgi:hypothetical protein
MMTPDNNICLGIQKAIEQQINLIIEEEAREAAQRVEAKVRERAAMISARVLERFEMSTYEKKLRILIDFEHINP